MFPTDMEIFSRIKHKCPEKFTFSGFNYAYKQFISIEKRFYIVNLL